MNQTTTPTWPPPDTTAPPSWPHYPPPPPPPPPVGQRPWYRKKRVWALGILGLLIVSAAVSGTEAEPTSVASGGAVTSRPATTSRSGSSAISGSSEKSAMVAWVTRHESDMTTIIADLQAGEAAAGAGSITALISACSDLEDDVRIAQSHLPMPAASVNAPYSSALRYFVQAAQACQSYSFDTSGTYLALGSGQLRQATSALEAYQD